MLRALFSVVYLSPPGLSGFGFRGKNANYSANKFVKAIKGTEKWRFKGNATVPIPGKSPVTFSWLTRERAAPAFAARMWPRISLESLGTLGLVPIPSSDSTLAKPRPDCGPVRLAQAIASVSNGSAAVCDVLRWDRDHGSVSRGSADRDPAELFRALVLTETLDPNLDYVLVDDNITTGAHLQASAARLLKDGGAEVLVAISAGRTVSEAWEDPFAGGEEKFDHFQP